MLTKKRKKLIDAVSDDQVNLRAAKNAPNNSGQEGNRDNLSSLHQIQFYLSKINDDIKDEIEKIDWNKSAEDIVRKAENSEIVHHKSENRLSNIMQSAPYKLGFAAVSALAIGFILFTFLENRNIDNAESIVRSDSMDRIETTLAKNETVEYLKQSSIVLSSVANMPESDLNPAALKQNADQARNLLLKKKYINQNLSNYKLVKAQSVCNQVEYLLYDISQLDNKTDQEQVEIIRSFIEDKKIMLKIKLVQSELTNKEV